MRFLGAKLPRITSLIASFCRLLLKSSCLNNWRNFSRSTCESIQSPFSSLVFFVDDVDVEADANVVVDLSDVDDFDLLCDADFDTDFFDKELFILNRSSLSYTIYYNVYRMWKGRRKNHHRRIVLPQMFWQLTF